MGKLIAIWQFLNGKKTVIGAVMFATHDLLVALSGFWPVCADIAVFVKEAAYVFTGAGLGHKLAK